MPDALSIGRFLSLAPLLWLLAGVEPSAGGAPDVDRVLAIALLVTLAATDRLDGYLARRLDAVSSFGSAADAVADKTVQFGPLLYFALVGSPAFTPVPLWLPTALLALDLLLTAVWGVLHLAMGRRLPASHNAAGRVTGLLLFALVIWITADLPAPGVAVGGPLAVAVSVVSAGWYVRDWYRGSGG